MMGGSIWIESELGEGATFKFTFLVKKDDGDNEDSYKNANWNNLKVLAVDYDADVLESITEIFGELGVECKTAVSSEDALRQVEKDGAFDIYFIDWKMPEIDGIELTRRIRELDTSSGDSVFIIMISSLDWNVIEHEAKATGINQFLSKPLFSSIIADIINDHFKDGPGGNQNERKEAALNFSGRRILLAEDVDINREIVMTLLGPTQIEFDCAENGAEAVLIFNKTPDRYDMILMDVQMPEMDGYEATRKIRESGAPNAKDIPIIAMTANVFSDDVEKCLNAGMNDHVGKPLDFEDVLNKLQKYF
jgi:CheY-like chemotaxis protein